MSATMVSRKRKFNKKHWLKCPKAVPQKAKFEPKYKWFKISQSGTLFLKILFRAYNIFIFVLQTFLSFMFSCLKRSHILQYSFAQKISLILRTLAHLTLKIICSLNTAKNLSELQIFQQTCFCLVSEKIFALQNFLTPKNCISEALWKQMIDLEYPVSLDF